MTIPIFSVVIPTFNRSGRLVEAVESVLAQSFSNFEVVVIDDAGSDDSRDRIYELRDDRVAYFRLAKNEGSAAARNAGIRVSKGEWICFLDSDDLWMPDRLFFAKDVLERNKYAVNNIYWSSLIFDRGDGVRQIKPDHTFVQEDRLMTYLLCRDGLIQTSTLIVSAEVAKNIQFDDSMRIHDDYTFLMRLEHEGLRFVHDSRPCVIWRNDEVNSSERVSTVKGAERNFAWLNKYRYWLSFRERLAYNALFLIPKLKGAALFKAVVFLPLSVFVGALTVRRAALIILKRIISGPKYARVGKFFSRNASS